MSFNNLKELQSELLSKSCVAQIRKYERFGVFLKRLDFDIPHFIQTLSESLNEINFIRVGLFGVNVKDFTSDKLEVSSDGNKINQWRNKEDNIPLVVFDDSTTPKSQSLDSVLQPLDNDIYRETVKNYLEEVQPSNINYINFSENICRLKDLITNNKLVQFLYNCHSNKNFEENLYVLSLMIDKKLFSNQSFAEFKKLFKSHQSLLSSAKRLDKKKKRIMDVSKDRNGTNFQELGETAKNLIKLDKNPRDLGIIQELEYEKVKKLLNIKETTPAVESIKSVIIDELIIREIISNNKQQDEGEVKQGDFKNKCELLYEVIKENSSIYQILDEYSDYFTDTERFKLVERGKKNRDRFDLIYNFFGNEKNYGGVIDLSQSDETIFEKKLEQSKENGFFKKLSIDESNDKSAALASNFIEYLINYTEDHQEKFPNTKNFRDTINKFLEIRDYFINKKEILFECPLFYIHYDIEIKIKIEEYINLYISISETVNEYCTNITTDFSDILKSNFLGFDIIFLLEDDNSNRTAYLYPFHPLSLWRWKKFSEVIISNETEIQNLSSERNKKEELLDKIKNPYTTSSDVVLHKSLYNFTGDTSFETFTPNYSLNSLPMYLSANSTSVIEADSKSIIKVISSLFNANPALHFGLKIFLINPPPYEILMRELNRLKNPFNGKPIKLDIVVRHTQKRSSFYEIDKVKLDDQIELLNSRGGSFDEKNNEILFKKVLSEIQAFDPHFTFIFSLQGYATHIARNNLKPEINPFFLAKQYSIDDGTQKITTSFASDNNSFSIFSKFAKSLMGRSDTQSDVNLSPDDVKLIEDLNSISPKSLFCLSSEKVINDGIRLESSIILDKRSDQFSDLLTFTHTNQKEIILQVMTKLFEERNFYPSNNQLDEYIEIIQKLSTEFIASINFSKNQTSLLAKTEASGIIGLLRVAKKYYDEISDSVLISLDDDKSNFWLKKAYDDKQVRRSDLLSIRIDSLGKPVLDIIEVKTSEDLAKAKEQVAATYNNLIKILNNKDVNSFDNIRKQILQEQLIHTLIRQHYSNDKTKKLFDAITNFFNKQNFDKDDFNLKIFFVKINPNVPSSDEIKNIPISDIDKSVERYYLDVSSDVENVTIMKEDIPINDQNKDKEEIEITLTPNIPSTSTENQETETSTNTSSKQNSIIDGKYLIGKDINTDDDVYWDTNDLTNYSLLVTGDSGQGKTWTIKRIVTQSTKNDAPCFIINVKGDDFDERFAQEYKFNYLDIDDEGLPFNPLMPIERNGKYRPKRDIDELQSIIMRLVELTPLQGSLFYKALYSVYLNCGAPDQTRIPKEEFDLNPEPTLELLYEVLDNFAESSDNSYSARDVALLKNKLDIIKNYDIFQVSQIPFEDLINGRWILDISTFADTIKNLILEIFISRIDNYMRTLPGEDRFRSLIVFDEAHRVKDNNQLEEFMRECRAFGFGVIFGTQLPKDLGPDIASHCASQISHRSSDYENRKTAITSITGESRGQEFQDSLSNLQGFKQGQGYYRTSTKTEGLTYKSVKFLPYKEN